MKTKQSIIAAAGWAVLFSMITGFILGKIVGAIQCQSNFQCAYSLAGFEWLPMASVLNGIVASGLLVWLGKDGQPVNEVVVD